VVVAAIFYIVAGSLHFIKPVPYLRIMPSYIPWHTAIVRISGVCEVLGGLGLLVPPRAGRRPAHECAHLKKICPAKAGRARVCTSEKVCPAA